MNMKKIITEVAGEGLEALLGEHVMLFCANYIYCGTLAGVNQTCVLLENPKIVYETGAFEDKNYKDVQALHTDKWYVQMSAIESFGVGKSGK
jgi:hypothetical protein